MVGLYMFFDGHLEMVSEHKVPPHLFKKGRKKYSKNDLFATVLRTAQRLEHDET